MQFPYLIELRRSRLFSLLLVFVHTIAACCIGILPWPVLLRSAFVILVGLSLRKTMRPSNIHGLRIPAPDKLEGVLIEGAREVLTILPDSTVFGQLIVLRLRIGDAKQLNQLVLLPDQMSTDQFRVLRLWLRWHSETKQRAVAFF